MDLTTARNSIDRKLLRKGDRNKEIDKENDSNRAAWTEPQRIFLVSLLVEFSTPEHRTDNGWTRIAWTEMTKRFAERFPGANFNIAQIKEQERHLKKRLKSLQRVLSMSGVGWNNDLKQINFQDATVEEALMNDKEVRQWHGKSFPYYNDLLDLHKGSIATDARRNRSKQVRNKENGELKLKSHSPTIPCPGWSQCIDMDNGTDNEPCSSTIKEPIICSEPEDFPSTQAQPETSTHEPLASEIRNVKRRKAIGKFHDEYLPYKREEERLICATMERNSLSANCAERFSINAAMVAFQELEGFDIVDLYVASKMFMADAGVREAFLSCKEKNRAGWIMLMIDQYKVKQNK